MRREPRARERKLIWCDPKADGIVRMEEETRIQAYFRPTVFTVGFFFVDSEKKENYS